MQEGNRLELANGTGFNPVGGVGWYNTSGTWISFTYAATVNDVLQGFRQVLVRSYSSCES